MATKALTSVPCMRVQCLRPLQACSVLSPTTRPLAKPSSRAGPYAVVDRLCFRSFLGSETLSPAAALVDTGGIQLLGRKRPFLFSQSPGPEAAIAVTAVR